jgi:hypothetical protein
MLVNTPAEYTEPDEDEVSHKVLWQDAEMNMSKAANKYCIREEWLRQGGCGPSGP